MHIRGYLQDIILLNIVWKDSRLIKTSAKSDIKLINTQSIGDVPCGIMWSFGMVRLSIMLCVLIPDVCVWCFYVRVGIFPWARVKRKTTYSPRENDIKWWWPSKLMCASSRGASQRSHMLEACRPFGVNGLVKMFLKWLTHNRVWGSNLLVFIERTESSMIHLEAGVIVIIKIKWIIRKAKVWPW